MKLTDVIRRPLVTEKTTILREDGRTIVFQVATGANKIEIKQAIEKLLGSKVESIRTAMAHGKVKRQGRFSGRRSDWKKAYVRLKLGEKMPEFLEGARRRAGMQNAQCKMKKENADGRLSVIFSFFIFHFHLAGFTYADRTSDHSAGRRFQTVQVFDEITTRIRTGR